MCLNLKLANQKLCRQERRLILYHKAQTIPRAYPQFEK